MHVLEYSEYLKLQHLRFSFNSITWDWTMSASFCSSGYSALLQQLTYHHHLCASHCDQFSRKSSYFSNRRTEDQTVSPVVEVQCKNIHPMKRNWEKHWPTFIEVTLATWKDCYAWQAVRCNDSCQWTMRHGTWSKRTCWCNCEQPRHHRRQIQTSCTSSSQLRDSERGGKSCSSLQEKGVSTCVTRAVRAP